MGLAAVAVATVVWIAMRDDDAGRAGRDGPGRTRSEQAIPAAPDGCTDGADSDEPRETRTVPVRVVDERKQPIAGADVASKQENGVSVRTDADGRAVVAAAADSPYLHLVVTHLRYLRVEQWALGSDEVVIEMKRGAPFAVTVLAPDKSPVVGANITAKYVRQGGMSGFWAWTDEDDLGVAKTDASGRAVLPAMPELPVALGIDHPNYPLYTETVEIAGVDPIEHMVRLPIGGAIEGTVYGPDGAPVAHAKVNTGHPRPTATTDENGKYRLAPVGNRAALVSASSPDYGPAFFGEQMGWGQAVPVHVRPGEVVGRVDIRLGVATFVVGRLLDDKNAPVKDVQIDCWPHGNGQSDAEGKFRLGPLHTRGAEMAAYLYFQSDNHKIMPLRDKKVRAGATLDVGDIRATRRGIVRGVVNDGKGRSVGPGYVHAGQQYADVKPDGTFELRGVPVGRWELVADVHRKPSLRSQPFDFSIETPGQVLDGIELTALELKKTGGRVVTPDGRPRAVMIAVVAAGGSAATRLHVQATKDGKFFAYLTPGRYKFGLPDPDGRFGRSGKFRATPEPIVVDAGRTDLELVVPIDGVIITGRVVSKRNRRPLAQVRLGFLRYKFFVPVDTHRRQGTDADGRFFVELDDAGTYQVDATADGLASVRTDKFTVKQGAIHDVGTLRLGEGGTIAGQVVDAQGVPVPYTRINILDTKLQTNRLEPFTDQEGRFSLSGVSPGRYTVFAVSPRHPLGLIRGIDVVEAETTDVNVRFVQPSPLTVTVRGVGNRPLEGAKLWWTFPDIAPLTSKLAQHKIPPGYGNHVAGADGLISQPSLPPGEVTISVEAKGYNTVTRKVHLAAGEENRVEIRLRKD